jgi:hypothetical protein
MRSRAAIAVASVLLVSACGMLDTKTKPRDTGDPVAKPDERGAVVSRCPVPLEYDEQMLRMIQQSIDALPPDSVLRKVLKDYENERDDLRFCK